MAVQVGALGLALVDAKQAGGRAVLPQNQQRRATASMWALWTGRGFAVCSSPLTTCCNPLLVLVVVVMVWRREKHKKLLTVREQLGTVEARLAKVRERLARNRGARV